MSQSNVGRSFLAKFGTVGVVVIVVVLAVAVAAGVYLAGNYGKGGSTHTSVPSPLSSSGGNPSGSTSAGSAVLNASSLQYTITVTNSSGKSQGTWIYSAKNIASSNLLMRIEYTSTDTNYTYIVNGVQQKVWVSLNGYWVDESTNYAGQLNTWNNAFNLYRNYLTNWVGTGGYTYHESNGDTVQFTNISLNPNISDSFFTPTG